MPELDLISNPGTGPCDRCGCILPREQFFEAFWFCQRCVIEVAEVIGKNAIGCGISRMSELERRNQELALSLGYRKGA